MKSKLVVSTLILTLLLTFALTNIPVKASGSSTFSLKPAEAKARAGTTLGFRLMGYNVTEMNSWTATIEWESDKFDMTIDPLEGDGLTEGWMESTFTFTLVADGKLELSDALSGGNIGDNVTFDEGWLAMVYLTAEVEPPSGGTTISITAAEYKDPAGVPTTPATEDAVVIPPGAGVTVIEWLTHWTSIAELGFWDQCIAEFEVDHPDIHVVLTGIDFESLFDVIMTRFAAGEDPDLIHMHAMWVPRFVMAEMLSIPPDDVQTEVETTWTAAPREGARFLHTIWGYPTEFNSWALLYNKKILEEVAATNATVADALATLNAGGTLTWGIPSIGQGELEKVAEACTDYDEYGVINRTGFYPLYDAGPEEERFQFMNLLWSNAGTFIDFEVPEARFNDTAGVEVLELYKWSRFKTWDPVVHPAGRIWWEAWQYHEIALFVCPTWMTYIRDALGWESLENPGEFTNATFGIAPVPTGPSGVTSYSLVYSWIATVTKKAEERTDYVGGPTHAEAAWTFLKWINEPKADARSYGIQPDAHDVTPMGDYLLTDMIIPSRASDQENFPICTELFWFDAFIHTANQRADTYFKTSEEVQDEVFYMIENVATDGLDPETEADAAAAAVNHILPVPGDVNCDNIVDIFDLVVCGAAFGSVPGDANWDPRADVVYDSLIDIFDLVYIAVNFGRTPPP